MDRGTKGGQGGSAGRGFASVVSVMFGALVLCGIGVLAVFGFVHLIGGHHLPHGSRGLYELIGLVVLVLLALIVAGLVFMWRSLRSAVHGERRSTVRGKVRPPRM